MDSATFPGGICTTQTLSSSMDDRTVAFEDERHCEILSSVADFLNRTRTSSGAYSPDKIGRDGESVNVGVAEFSATIDAVGVDEGRLVAVSVDSTIKADFGVSVKVGWGLSVYSVAVSSKVGVGVESLP